jgi:predicted metal-dependent peptidase
MIVLKYDAFNKFAKFVNESKDTQNDPNNLLLKEVKGDVSRCVSVLIATMPFFGEYLLTCRFLYGHPDVDTMATDGKNIFINPRFASTLSDTQMIFILAHEVLHCVLQHHTRMRDKLGSATRGQATKWNYAADYEINPMLVQEGLISKTEVKDVLKGCYEDKYIGQSAEYIYDQLGAESEEDQETPGGDEYSEAQIGDPISTPNGDYGVITKINADGTFVIDPLTKEEAYEIAKNMPPRF